MNVVTVLGRELRAMMAMPQSYGIAAAFLALSGFFFVTFLLQSSLPDLERYYANVATTLLVLCPVVSARSFAEERRLGVLDITLSWAMHRHAYVLGKYLANTLYVSILVGVALLYLRLLTSLGSVEVGKALSGLVGVVLLGAALSALSLAVSARSDSPAAAAFIGFGLLLGLWSFQYAPRWFGTGWLGRALASLSPANHLEASGQGILRLGDAAYFAFCIVVGLLLALEAINRQRAGRAEGVRLRTRARMATIGLAAVGAVVAAPTLHGQVDLTTTKRYTLTAASESIARRVKAPIAVIGFAAPDTPRIVEMRNLVRRYQEAGVDLRFEVIDPDSQPGRARRYGVSRYEELLVTVGDRSELLDAINEIALTSAIFRLSQEGPHFVCFTVGHGEPAPDDPGPEGFETLAITLRRLGYETTTLALGGPGGPQRLARCRVVVTAPRVPLLPEEAAMVGDYLRSNGSLVVLADPTGGARAQLDELLTPWGLGIGAGSVEDRSSLTDDPSSVVAFDYPSANPATAELKQHAIPTLFVRSHPVVVSAGGANASAIRLVAASARATLAGKAQPERPLLAAAVDASRMITGSAARVESTRVAVLGTTTVATNRFIDLLGNRDFMSGIVQFVGRENDIVRAGRDFGGVGKVVLTQAQHNRIVHQGIVAPAVVALLPLPFAVRRLRRG